ncbi:MAG: SulP family inorganic anion transporter [Thermodesulfobacteriota bacterium]|nr:SulP family inorganic anion transporter [Thermodesulfobacteriota bacterium]
MAVFRCQSCGYTEEVANTLAGQKAKCPECEAVVEVKAEESDLLLDEAMDDLPPVPEAEGDPAPDIFEQDLGRDIADGGEEISEKSVSLFHGGFPKNVAAGLITGLLTSFFSLSFAGLVFSDPSLSGYFPHAVSTALITAAVAGVFIALGSRIPFAVAGPESTACVVLFLLVSSLSVRMSPAHPAQAIYPTIVAAIAVTATAAGLCLYAVGMIRAGAWIRFIPYQIVGGILAGVGFLILKGTFSFAVGMNFSLDQLSNLISYDFYIKWLPPLLFGLLLLIVFRWLKSPLFALFLLLAACGGTHAVLLWQGISPEQASAAGWLFSPFPADRFWEVYKPSFLLRVEWGAILDHIDYIAAMAGLVIATVMLKITDLETNIGNEVDLDRELRVLGGANTLTGLCGGMPGSLSLGRSLGGRRVGARGPLAGIVAGGFCCVVLFYAHTVVPYIPVFVPAGLLAYIGLSLMVRWLVDTRSEFTQSEDYALLFLVFLLTAVFGFLPGVAVGTAMALMVVVSRYGRVSVVKLVLSGAHHRSNVDRAPFQFKVLKQKGERIYILRLQGFVFLGATNSLLGQIRARAKDKGKLPVRFVVLDFSRISGLDSSVAISFTRLKQMARQQEFTLVFTNVPFEVEQQLEQGGFTLEDPDGFSKTFMSLDFALEWCEDQILEEENALSVEEQTLPQLLESVFPEPKYIPLLMKCMKKVRIKEGEHVFHQGDASDAMYFIEHGMVNVQLELEGGKILRLKKMGPGTTFGEMGIYTSAPRSASIVAAEDCVLYRLSSKVLEVIQSKNPRLVSSIHRFIVNLLSERVAQANDEVRDLLA